MLRFIFFRVWRHACLDLFCPTWWGEIIWVHSYHLLCSAYAYSLLKWMLRFFFTHGIWMLRFIFSGSLFTDLFFQAHRIWMLFYFSGSRFTDIYAYIYFFQGMETCVLRFILSNMVRGNYLSSFIPPFLFPLCLRFTDMNA
jgi:hypothetical protein